MSGFSATWLALRETYDVRARSPAVLNATQSALAGAASVAVVDLGCGTGSTLRAVTAHLPARQSWRLVDHDDTLLAHAKARAPATIDVTVASFDLARDLEAAIGDADEVAADLVTMSALLDLVSGPWLERLAATLARRRLPIYAALTYDGRVTLTPATQHDDAVIAAVNRHQLTDKGFGPALGPGAAAASTASFRRHGFDVVEGPSDWVFSPEDRDIQMEMLAGWAAAAREIGIAPAILDAWLGERRDHVTAGRSHMRVGHVDFFASPTGRR